MIFKIISNRFGKTTAVIVTAIIYFIMLNLIVIFSFFGAGQFRYANW